MNERVEAAIKKASKTNRQRKWYHTALVAMASAIVFCTVYALILPAITQERTAAATCGFEEHQHGEECVLRALSCGLEESEGHFHTSECYEERRALVCEEEEHTHSAENGCYDKEGNLLCEIPEHTHGKNCYSAERVLICGLEESGAHHHTEECYEITYICGKSEHVHTLSCFSDITADIETESDWEATLPKLIGIWAQDVVSVAESQLGYAESGRNYIVDYSNENEEIKGYTRYGAWYGDPYGDWSAMFASFCLNYAGVDRSFMPYGASCSAWAAELSDRGLYFDAEAAECPWASGGLVFFDADRDGSADHVGIVSGTDADSIKTIEGNVENQVAERSYELGDPAILGYASLPAGEDCGFYINGKELPAVYEGSGYDGVVGIEATFRGNILYNGKLPEDIQPQLIVEVDDDDPGLDCYSQDGSGYGLLALRLRLYVDGVELDISGCFAKVELNLKEELFPAGINMLGNGEDGGEETAYLTVIQGGVSLASEEIPDVPTAMSLSFNLSQANEVILIGTRSTSYNPEYTIQHYFWFPQVKTTDTTSAHQVQFIDTDRGGKYDENNNVGTILKNGTESFITKNVPLTDQWLLTTENVLKQLFIDEETTYQENPQVQYMSRLYNSSGEYSKNYTLSQIWVYQPGYQDGADGAAEGDFIVYNVPREVKVVNADGTVRETYSAAGYAEARTKYAELCNAYAAQIAAGTVTITDTALPERIRFTNNPANSQLTVKPVLNSEGKWIWNFAGDSDGSDGTEAVIEQQNNDGFSQYVVTAKSGRMEGYNYDYTILIGEGTIVRLVMRVTEDERTVSANFFDYNITDGKLYEGNSVGKNGKPNSTSHDTTEQFASDGVTPARKWYAFTLRQGINSNRNYAGNGAKYAFGNSNTGSGRSDEQLPDKSYFNKYNRGTNTTYKGLAFGIVNSIASDGTITWADGVTGPQIFTKGNGVTGKTDYDGELTFYRQGGTYTLEGAAVLDANGNSIGSETNLRRIGITYDNGSTVIHSNDFWPMDNLMGNKVSGNDLAFGLIYGNTKAQCWFNGSESGALPYADTASSTGPTTYPAENHNSYFGMSYSVSFTIDPGYSAPLMYWFYGDDDMWVFLAKNQVDADGNVVKDADGNPVPDPTTAKMVADIGGVHSSAGILVNLWDYVEPVPFYQADGKTESKPVSYTLSIYYTERGASGSTCYMRFTVPLDSITQGRIQGDEAILVEKELQNEYGEAVEYVPSDSRPEFTKDLTYFDEYDATNPAQVQKHGEAVEWVNQQADAGFFIYRIRLYDKNSQLPYQDLYHYEIYRAYKDDGTRTDHKNDSFICEGDIGSASSISGDYYFALRGGEYIVITGLYSGTEYSVRELTSDKYVTSFQLGSHTHSDSGQVDTLDPSAFYSDRAGTPDRLHVHDEQSGEYNNYVKFYNSPSTKTEVFPGNGKQVGVGDTVTYEVEWVNDTSQVTEVVINDMLDPGVDFVAAWVGSGTDENGAVMTPTDSFALVSPAVSYEDADGNTITYDSATHTVTWRLVDTSNSEGTVALQVRVNENARSRWSYYNDPHGEYGGYGGGSDDYQIVNQAQVIIDDHMYLTNIPRNPVRDPRPSEIYKVDQYGNPVQGASFAAYRTNGSYAYLVDNSGSYISLTEGEYTVNDGVITVGGNTITPVLTMTTGENGAVQFRKPDGTVYSQAELKETMGSYFVLREIGVPEGYRSASDEIRLYFDGSYLLVEGRTVSGASSAARASVTASEWLYGITPDSDGNYYYVNGNAPYYTRAADGTIQAVNGTLFAVVLKKNGSNGGVDDWYPVVLDPDGGFSVSSSSGIVAAINAAQSMGEGIAFAPSADNRQMEVNLNHLPGNIVQYFTYQWEKAIAEGRTPSIDDAAANSEYFIAYYYTTSHSLSGATLYNTTRVVSRDKIVTAANNGSDPNRDYVGFGVSWGAAVNISNYENRVFFQKRDVNGNPVNNAVFALYSVGETNGEIYYVADGGEHIYLEDDPYGNNAGNATVNGQSGKYTISAGKWKDDGTGSGGIVPEDDSAYNVPYGTITVMVGEETYTITPKQVGHTHDGANCAYLPTTEQGSGHFTRLSNGYYVMREIYAPEPYALNTTEVRIAVDGRQVYANSGGSDNGVSIGRGPGYLAAAMSGLASQTNINETLTWISMTMQINTENTFAGLSNEENWHYATNIISMDSEGNAVLTPYGSAGALTTDQLSIGADPELMHALITYLEYDSDGGSSVFNYSATGIAGGTRYGAGRDLSLDDEQARAYHTVHPIHGNNTYLVDTASGEGTRRLYTNTGWTRLEIYQDYGYGLERLRAQGSTAAFYQVNGDISALFSQSTFIVVTDPKQVELRINKVNEASAALIGAEFVLSNNDENARYYCYDSVTDTVSWVDNVNVSGTVFSTNDVGEPIIIPRLTPGTYYLREIKAPAGYTGLALDIEITIDENGAVTMAYGEHIHISGSGSLPDSQWAVEQSTAADGALECILTVPNTSGYELPETGGAGMIWYTIGGLSIMTVAAAVYGCNKGRKRERRIR